MKVRAWLFKESLAEQSSVKALSRFLVHSRVYYIPKKIPIHFALE